MCTRVRVSQFVAWLSLVVLLPLVGCSTGPYFIAKNEPWRAEEEHACLAAGAVRETPFIRSRTALGGPSVCGAARPFEMTAADGGRVMLRPAALLRCPMVPQIDRWIATVLNPAAVQAFRVPVAEVIVAGSYSCRPINGQSGGYLSEHGHANAIDISGFVLADGRKVTVLRGWEGDPAERWFLRAVHQGACRDFTTVLGPGFNPFHRDHFHFDLARRGQDGLGNVCK